MGDVVDIATRRPTRVLPHNLDIEASVLGGVILRNEQLEMLDRVVDLSVDDFYDMRHKVVWQAIRNLQASHRQIDVVTLEGEIEKQGKLDAINGIAFLGELALRVPTADNVAIYARDMRDLAANRRAIIEMAETLESAWKWPHGASEMLDELTARLARIKEQAKPAHERVRLMSVSDALDELAELQRAPVFPTPFDALNEAMGFGGFLGTQVYTVAAGTGRGKTTWVIAVGAHAAQTVPVIVASYEMKPGYFVARKAAGVLGTHSNEIIRGGISIGAVLRAMPYPRMHFMHKRPLDELRVAVDIVAQKYGCAPLVIVDYIQKLADEIALRQARPDLRIATSLASATLCEIAERTGAAVIAVSAIGRGKGRLMSNPRKAEPYELVEVAKESGAVEYDGAGLIVLSLSKEKDPEDGSRIATMTLAKARFGEECHIDSRYEGRRGIWRSLERVEVADDGKSSTAAKPVAAPKVEESNDELRKRMIQELHTRVAKGKDDIVERTKGNKAKLRTVYEDLITEGVIVKIKGAGVTLSEVGRQQIMKLSERGS
jgi:replicative DNA helicase